MRNCFQVLLSFSTCAAKTWPAAAEHWEIVEAERERWRQAETLKAQAAENRLLMREEENRQERERLAEDNRLWKKQKQERLAAVEEESRKER